MKTVSAIFSLLLVVVVLAVLPAGFALGFARGEFLTAWFTFGVWNLILFALANRTFRNGQRELGELKDILKDGEYYKLLGIVRTPKGHLLVVMERTGDIRTCLKTDADGLVPGVWYTLKSFGTVMDTTTYLSRVEDEIAIATLEKGYRPQWAA
jgi:hypothetical protein